MRLMDTYRVVAPHYVAGLDVENGIVIEAAPILHWASGQRATKVFRYLCEKQYIVELIAKNGLSLAQPKNICLQVKDV